MRIVITGGTGLIGSALATRLARADWDVVVLSRSARAIDRLPAGVRWAIWDGRSAGPWIEELEGADALANLAGESVAGGRWTASRKRAILESRTRAATAITTALARVGRKPRVVLQASAVGYYGDRGEEILRESAAPGRGFLAETTLAWEQASEGIVALGVRRVVLRTGLVLARGGGALPKMALPFRFGLGGPIGDGRAWMPWIHLEDQIGAMNYLLAHPSASGPFNLAAPEPVTNAQWSRALARALRRPCLLRVPRAALEVALGELSQAVLASVRALPDRLTTLGFRFRFPALQPALADLFAA